MIGIKERSSMIGFVLKVIYIVLNLIKYESLDDIIFHINIIAMLNVLTQFVSPCVLSCIHKKTHMDINHIYFCCNDIKTIYNHNEQKE